MKVVSTAERWKGDRPRARIEKRL